MSIRHRDFVTAVGIPTGPGLRCRTRRPRLRGHTFACWLTLLLLLPIDPDPAHAVNLSRLPDHPRLILTASMLQTLRAEKQAGQPKASMYQEIQRRAEAASDDPLSGDYLAIMNLALVGWVDQNNAYLRKAVEQLMYKQRHGGWAWDSKSFSLAYDWLYPSLSVAQRDTLRHYIYSIYGPGVGGQRTVYYNLEANEATFKGLAGLACYGDGGTAEQDARFQALVDEWDGRMRGVGSYAAAGGTAASRGGVLPARQFYFPDGGYYKGNHYLQKDLDAVTTYLYLFDDLKLGAYWDLCGSYLDNIAEYLLRIRRPDGLSSRIMAGSNFGWDMRGLEALAVISEKRGNGLAAWILAQQDWTVGTSGGYEWYLIFPLYRPKAPQIGPTELVLYKFYGAPGSTPDPSKSWSEQIMTRTGWTIRNDAASRDVYFHLTAGDYFGDYSNWFEPTFEIYYRGALATRSGYYTDGDHDRYYYSNNVSCNSIVVFDSTLARVHDRWGEDRLYADSYGGPGRPVQIYDVRDQRSKFDPAEITAFQVLPEQIDGQDIYYAKARVNPNTAYPYTNGTRKLRKLEREFFWSGRHFVSCDRVEIDPSVAAKNKIRWLMHTINEPSLTGAPLYAVVPGHITLHARGAYSSTRGEAVESRRYGGQITVQPLLPGDALLRKVGGAGFECWVDSDWTHGTNYPPSNSSWYTNAYEVGRWRVETVVPTASATVDFLHYIYVGDPGEAAPTASVNQEAAGVVGCEIPGVGVFSFTREGGGSDGLRYEVTGENYLLPHSVGGLEAFAAYVVRVEGIPDRVVWTGEGGALTFFPGRPGAVQVISSSVAAVHR